MAGLDNTFKGFSTGMATGNPWIAAAGTAVGAGADLWSWLSGSKSRQQKREQQQPGMPGQMGAQAGPGGLTQVSNFNPQQQQLQGAAGNEALKLLQGGRPTGFQPIADEARANFLTKTVPSLAERFGNPGNERGSSALTGQLGAAGAGLDRGLAALEAQYGQNQQNSLLNAALKPSTDFTRQGPSALEQFSGDIASWLPKLLEIYKNYKQQSGEPASQEEFKAFVDQFQQYQDQNSGSDFSDIYSKGLQSMAGQPGYQYNLGGKGF